MTGPSHDADEPQQILITVDEAARRLSIGRSHVYAQMQRGLLRSVRIGRSRRILEHDLDAFVNELIGGQQGTIESLGSRPTRRPVKGIPLPPGRR